MDLSGEGRLFVVDPEIATLSNSPLVVCCASSRAVDPDWNDLGTEAQRGIQTIRRE